MSITKELREWASCQVGADTPWSEVERLTAIADRIDAEHEAKVAYWQGASYKDGYDEGFASVDDWLAQHEDSMAEHGWVRLPVDADGEYIHAGDEMEWLNGLKRGRVTAIGVGEREGWVWVLMDGKNVSIGNLASDLHHHKQPTIEDVLDEFVKRWLSTHHDDIPALKAEYAAKLRLADE